MTTPTKVTGSFATTANSGQIQLEKHFNLSLSGTFSATVIIQRSFDGGSTWKDIKSYTAAIEETGIEPESDVFYRLSCTHSTGTVTYRLAQTPYK